MIFPIIIAVVLSTFFFKDFFDEYFFMSTSVVPVFFSFWLLKDQWSTMTLISVPVDAHQDEKKEKKVERHLRTNPLLIVKTRFFYRWVFQLYRLISQYPSRNNVEWLCQVPITNEYIPSNKCWLYIVEVFNLLSHKLPQILVVKWCKKQSEENTALYSGKYHGFPFLIFWWLVVLKSMIATYFNCTTENIATTKKNMNAGYYLEKRVQMKILKIDRVFHFTETDVKLTSTSFSSFFLAFSLIFTHSLSH